MIRVKNRHIDWQEGMSLAVLLEKMGDSFPYAAALVNGQYVNRRDFESVNVPDEAEVVFISGVGGG